MVRSLVATIFRENTVLALFRVQYENVFYCIHSRHNIESTSVGCFNIVCPLGDLLMIALSV